MIENILDEITNCGGLRYFYINDNELVDLPDLSGINNIYRINAYNNKLEFDDIIPMVGNIPSLNYSPQDSIGELQFIVKTEDDNLSHTLVCGGEQNVYQWFKYGELLQNQTTETLNISNLSTDDSGQYYCEVNNPQAPLLTLTSRIISVIVEPKVELEYIEISGPVNVLEESTRRNIHVLLIIQMGQWRISPNR